MSDNELRLREFLFDEDAWPVADMGFVIGGEPTDGSAWAGGRVICHFGDDGRSECGEPPSPDDARRIERAWNCFDELVAAVHYLVDLTERSCPNCEGSIEAYERGKAILAKAQPEGVPSLSRPGVHQGQTPKK